MEKEVKKKSAHPFYGTPQWKEMRKRVLIRDGHQCVMCNANVSGFKKSRVDHIISRSKFGEGKRLEMVMSNLRTLCISCDAKRHSEKGTFKSNKKEIGTDGFPIGSEWG